MRCPKCSEEMSHNYCESWRAHDDTEGVDEYVTMIGYWSCYGCGATVGETDDEYYEPKD